jgi:predicted dehydrogenase
VPVDRALIVGHGSIGKRHLRLARQLLPQADIRVLRHQIATTVPEHADGCFTTLNEAIAFAPQIAAIASPAPFHLAAATPLARAGVHLLVEKPLSSSPAGVMELLTAAQEHKIVLLAGYNLRYLPSLQKFRQLLTENVIGTVLSVRCEIGQYLPTWRPDTDYRETVSAREHLGGGALLELSHELDYLRWIFGEIEWVMAWLGRQSRLEIDVEDTAHLVLGFKPNPNGLRLVGNLNMDFVRQDSVRLCTAIGEAGSLRWNGLHNTIEQYASSSGKWCEVSRHETQRDDSYRAEWRHFIACIEGDETPLVSGEAGLAVLKIIDAARRASASGCITYTEAAFGASLKEGP